jgi:hypothetical protein
MKSDAADRIATEIYGTIHDNVATKADIAAVRGDIALVRSKMREIEQRIVIRLGALAVVLVGLLFGGLHAWPPH